MAKTARKKKTVNARKATPRTYAPNKKRHNPSTRIVVIRPKQATNRKRPKRRSNPMFFGRATQPVELAKFVVGGLLGVTVNRAVMPMLPAALVGSNIAATITALALAAAEWWAASFVERDFGAAVGFGALMQAGSQALNAFVPSVGNVIGLSGRGRGTGDFVPGRYAVPQNPILDAIAAGNGAPSTGSLMHSAYPAAYGRVAA